MLLEAAKKMLKETQWIENGSESSRIPTQREAEAREALQKAIGETEDAQLPTINREENDADEKTLRMVYNHLLSSGEMTAAHRVQELSDTLEIVRWIEEHSETCESKFQLIQDIREKHGIGLGEAKTLADRYWQTTSNG
jgi:hypothetical protein